MKSKSFISLAAAAMLLSLAACSKDASEPVVTPDGPDAYAKVSLVMSKGSRAVTDDKGYDAGDSKEATVNSVLLVLYDGGNPGTVVGYGSTNTPGDVQGNPGSISDEYDPQIVRLTMLGNKSDAKYVVAYINVDNQIFDNLKGDAGALKQITNLDPAVDNKFFMTNAGYFDNGNWVDATEIVSGSIYSTQEAAAADNKVTTIYVERLAAKIKVTPKTTDTGINTVADVDLYAPDSETVADYQLKFNASTAKWAPTGTANEMYMVKQTFDSSLSWALAENRSYWAAGVYYNTEYDALRSELTYVSSNALRKTGGVGQTMTDDHIAYMREHTYAKAIESTDYNPLGVATSVIILGQYEITGTGVDKFKQGSDFDFYLQLKSSGVKDGYTIYSGAEMMMHLLKVNGLDLYTAETGDDKVTVDNVATYFTVKQDKDDKKYYLNLIEDQKVYEGDGTTNTEYTGTFDAGVNASHYNKGFAYFYAPIEHNYQGADKETTGVRVGQYGVVRNHSYEMTVNSITSLGAPLDDSHYGENPDNPNPEDPGEEPIVPEPEKEALIKAELKVLSWHVISQGVDL